MKKIYMPCFIFTHTSCKVSKHLLTICNFYFVLNECCITVHWMSLIQSKLSFINSDSYIPQCYTADREVIGGKARSWKLRCSNASNTAILWISVFHCWKENITSISIDFNNKVITVIVFCFSGVVKSKKKKEVKRNKHISKHNIFVLWEMWHFDNNIDLQ